MEDFIAKPRKWFRTSDPLKVGDIVLFLTQEAVLGESFWKIGRVVSWKIPRDGVVRRVKVEYRNPGEYVFRTTERPIRNMARLHKEGELELKEQLAAASTLQEPAL